MGIVITKRLTNGFDATYARPLASPSFRFDSGKVELVMGLYKDAEARFGGAEPAEYDRLMLDLTEAERAAILTVLYPAITRTGCYADGVPRDPDPEKEDAEDALPDTGVQA